jgi:transposase-like protein
MEKDKGERAEIPGFEDVLTELLRKGARELIMAAVQAEMSTLMASYQGLKLADGRQAVVRNGYLPARELMTGLGRVKVSVPKSRDRSSEGIRFSSSLIPPYLKRSQNLEELLPVLYLKGISTGDFQEALEALLGEGVKGLSAASISRLKASWSEEYESWRKAPLTEKMIYLWVDGLYLNVRLEDSRHCLLVVMGLTEGGEKRFLAIEDGFRESEQSWFEVLTKLKARGMSQAPELAIGDGALGFWKALSKLYPETKQQRCWVHKTKNVLDKVPKATQPKMKQALKDIYLAETKTQAEAALETLLKSYQAKYPQACECLSKDSLLSFYDFPAEHWRSIRTTNPIESVFATFSLRTDKTRGCLSRQTGLAMVYKLAMSAQKTMWSWPITLDKNHRDIKFCQEVKDVRENREKGL